MTERQGVTAAAGAIYSTARDMARYLAAMLGGGVGEHGFILKPETLAMMFAPHYQPDPRIPRMGLGFFRASLGGHPAVEHQGVVPGFNSQIFLAPNDRAGVMVFTHGAANVFATLWLLGEAERLLRDLIGAQGDGARADVPYHPEIWGELCGWYRRRAQPTDTMAWSMVGAGAEVGVRRGQLVVRTLGLIPVLYRGPSAASRRRGRPVRVPGRPLAVRHGHALERDSVVIRTVHPSAPVRIDYRLSDLGTSLLEPLAALRQWAIDHLDDVVLARKAHDVSDEDAAGLSSDQAPAR